MQERIPETRQALFERLAVDPVFFLETFVSIPDMEGKGKVPFILNSGQRRYVKEIWEPGIQGDIVAKSRKWGFSTLRLGLGLWALLYHEGRAFRVVAHRLETAKFLNRLVRTMFESAWALADTLDGGAAYYFPRAKGDRETGYTFINDSSLTIDTASGKGVGRADKNDDLYLTEYADWSNAEISFTGLAGSQPLGSPHNRLTVDFNARGFGNDAYTKYTNAKKKGTADWNGLEPFFIGVLDVPEIYKPELLEEKKRLLGKLYPESYPSNDIELFLANDAAVFDHAEIEAACRKFEAMGGYPGGSCSKYIHGVDTATGVDDGDWQVMITLGWVDGAWVVAAPPIRTRIPEDLFAVEVDRRAREFPGIVVVERNVGSAVIVKLREFGTPNLYRHKDRDKTGTIRRQLGFPTTYGTKKIMLSDLQQSLRDGEVIFPEGPIAEEMRIYEWKRNVDGKENHGLAGAPDKEGAHDDAVMALALALQGAPFAFSGSRVEYTGA